METASKASDGITTFNPNKLITKRSLMLSVPEDETQLKLIIVNVILPERTKDFDFEIDFLKLLTAYNSIPDLPETNTFPLQAIAHFTEMPQNPYKSLLFSSASPFVIVQKGNLSIALFPKSATRFGIKPKSGKLMDRYEREGTKLICPVPLRDWEEVKDQGVTLPKPKDPPGINFIISRTPIFQKDNHGNRYPIYAGTEDSTLITKAKDYAQKIQQAFN